VTLNRVWMPSPNYSSGRSSTRLLIIHTAEGARTIESLGSFFANPDAEVSSQVGIDDTPNTVGEYVRNTDRSWAAASFNGVAVQAELCAFAEWSGNDWAGHPTMLENTAAWLAEEAARFGIPLELLTAEQAQGNGRGVCGHNELGAAGGGHWDPGPSFPWSRVLDLARGDTSPTAPAQDFGGNMLITCPPGGYWIVDAGGGVFAHDGAPFHNSLPGLGVTPSAPIIGGESTPLGDGYWLVGRDGMVYAFGRAPYLGPTPRYTAEWGIGTADNPCIGIAQTIRGGDVTYVIGAERAGEDPASYVMEPDGRYGH
jgi:hypothetical protein